MRMLSLRFSNLNSLYGEWEIDFTKSEIQDSGLFAITGTTGAGKSTILDALCLALYGETPRLNQITGSSNEVMSRNTGECYAELEYEMGSQRYLSRWSQKRARGQADQKLQAVKREISKWNEEKQSYDGLASKLKDVGITVAKVTGMNFQRFTRTILLAQGNFAAFLRADVTSRSSLLEQITGSDIYTQISVKVHERHRKEAEKLKEISYRMQGVQLLSDDDKRRFLNTKATLQAEMETLVKSRQASATKIQWLKKIASIEEKLDENRTLLEKHKKLITGFTSRQIQLDAGKRAAKVKPSYVALASSQKEESELTERQKILSAQIAEGQIQLKEGEKFLQQLEVAHQKKEGGVIEQRIIWKSVRELDTKIDSLQKQYEIERRKVEVAENSCGVTGSELAKLTSQKEVLEKELQSSKQYLETNTSDERALGRSEVVRSEVEQWVKGQSEVISLLKKIEQCCASIEKGKRFIEEQQNVIKTAQEKLKLANREKLRIEHQRKELLDGKLVREHETELQHLSEKKELETSIQSLQEHRDQLIAGEECPLCGSKEHPFVDQLSGDKRTGRVAVIAAEILKVSERLKLINEADKSIAISQGELEKAMFQVKAEEDKIENYKNRLSELEVNQKELNTEKVEKERALEQIGLSLRKDLTAFDVKEEVTEAMLRAFSSDLAHRGQRWKVAIEKAQPLQEQLVKIEASIAQQSERYSGVQRVLKEHQKDLEESKVALQKISSERKSAFADKSVNEVELATEDELKRSLDQMAKEKERHQVKVTGLAQKNQSLQNVREQRSTLGAKLVDEQSVFISELSSHGFEDVAAFKSALIDEVLYQALKFESKELGNEGKRLMTLSTSLELDLKVEKEKELTDETLENLNVVLAELEKRLIIKNQDLGQVNQLLKTDEENLSLQAEDAEKLQVQQKELKVWKQLHDLIGSSDGKKFRNYAQGLTFEWVVSLANKKLATISDRYLLVRDKEEPLELNVLDNYQGGEIRSTKNLSGGESFVISLALALGLSQMVSENIKMDSLFLDEGFGTLDEETMETVMDALGALRQEGKLIGVISHVPELKERLAAQIVVTTQNGGKSTLSGAGVIVKSTCKSA